MKRFPGGSLRIGVAAITAFVGIVAPAKGAIISFEQASRLMLEENPDLDAIREQEEGYKLKARQSLAPNDPTFTVGENNVPGPKPFSVGVSRAYTVGYTLGFPGKAMAQSSQLSNQALMSREQAYQKEIELLTSLSNNYLALKSNTKLLALIHEEQSKASDTVKLTEKKYGMAQAAQTDILNAKFYQASLDHEEIVTQDARRTLLNQFRVLIRHPESQDEPELSGEIRIPDIKLKGAELQELMLTHRPALRSTDYQKTSNEAAVRSAWLGFFPDFQFSATMNVYHMQDYATVPGSVRDYNFSVGISIPLFFPLNQATGVQAAHRDLHASELALQAQREAAISDLKGLVQRFESSERQRKNLIVWVIPAAIANYQLTLKNYTLGRSDYIRLGDARRSYMQVQRDLLDRTLESAQTLNQITLQVGCDWMHEGGPHACR